MSKFNRYLSWILKIIISIGFMLASSGKLARNESVIQMFHDWGYFDQFYLIIGILELLAAILLLIPKTSIYAAIFLIILMSGALITHLIHDPLIEMIRPGIFMAFLGMIIYLQRDQIRSKCNIGN